MPFSLFDSASPFPPLVAMPELGATLVSEQPTQAEKAGDDLARILYARQRLLLQIRVKPALRPVATRAVAVARRRKAKRKQKCGRLRDEFRRDDGPSLRNGHRMYALCGDDVSIGDGCSWARVLLAVVLAIAGTFVVLRLGRASAPNSSIPDVHLRACIKLHHRGLLAEAVAECQVAEEGFTAQNSSLVASARNSLGLVLYDIGRIGDAIKVQTLAATADPEHYAVTLAMFRVTWLVTNLLTRCLVPLGIEVGFIGPTLAHDGSARLVYNGVGTTTSLERALAQPAIEACEKLHPCRAALEDSIMNVLDGQSPNSGAVPLGSDAALHLENEFVHIIEVFFRRRPRNPDGSPATPNSIIDFCEVTVLRFLAVLHNDRATVEDRYVLPK